MPKAIASTAPPVVISSTVAVTGTTGQAVGVRLTTNITHTASNDLDITLRAPNGKIVTITSDNGGTYDNVFNGTVWNDKADPGSQIPYGTNNPNVTTDHTYAELTLASPLVVEEALAAFNGITPNGVWTLSISDDTTANGGSLDGWSIQVTTAECGTCPTVDCGDGDACTADSCDPIEGCVHVPLSCDDGNSCTGDSCDRGLGASISLSLTECPVKMEIRVPIPMSALAVCVSVEGRPSNVTTGTPAPTMPATRQREHASTHLTTRIPAPTRTRAPWTHAREVPAVVRPASPGLCPRVMWPRNPSRYLTPTQTEP